MSDQNFLDTIDKSQFNADPYVRKVEKPWGYEIHWVPDGEPYMGKILHITAGKRLSLQAHDLKKESWFLLNGSVTMVIENAQGELTEVPMESGVGYTTRIGQCHRLVGVEDSDVLEVSTPEIGNTVRLEDDYARPTETEAIRQDPHRGWNPSE